MSGQGTIRACKGTIRAGEGTIRAGFLMLPHPLANLKYNSITKTNLNLMIFTQEIICPK